MRLLLDTQVFLWFVSGDERLSSRAHSLIEDYEHEVYLSAASIWETAIKLRLGKLHLAQPLEQLLPEQLSVNMIQVLPVRQAHALRVAALPLGNHRDPFDRLLVAQALEEGLSIVSVDRELDQYGITRYW